MSLVAAAHLATTCAYAGFQATIRFVVYAQFARVGAEDFVAYEEAHTRLVSLVVGPLFLGLGASSLALVAVTPAGVGAVLPLLALGLFGALLAVTAFGAVPQHQRLGRGFDAAAHRRLLRWDSVRLALALLSVAVAAVIAVAAD